MKTILRTVLFALLAASAAYLMLWRPEPHYVRLRHGQFSLNGKPFFPVVLNYQVILQSDRNGIWASPYADYLGRKGALLSTKDSALAQLRADMEFIREMGFNTVRIVGIGEEYVNKTTGALCLGSSVYNREDSVIVLNGENYPRYFDALREVLKIVSESGMKTILLTKTVPGLSPTEDHLIRLADEFRHDTSLMAYDLFNEPLYFDTLSREKKDIFSITRNWKKRFRKHAPDQLLTIGLVGVREVYEWDPNAVNVDFISFHPYEFEPNQVKNEMYWFSRTVSKPWIIGETGLASDNDSITYEQQKKFAESTLHYAVETGAAGYSWWQFKDVYWNSYHASYLGLLEQAGTSRTRSGKIITGTPKPVAGVFRNFRFTPMEKNAKPESNYYTFSRPHRYCLKGKLVDQENQAIENGLIMVWSEDWKSSFVTFTKADGRFEMYTETPMHHAVFSASLYTVTEGDVKPENAKQMPDGNFVTDLGAIQLWRVYF